MPPSPTTLRALRLMALDVGSRRIGVALSDHAGMFAHPHSTLDARGPHRDVPAIIALAREEEAGGIVVGLAAHADGTESASAGRCRRYATMLTEAGMAVDFEDEWGSSVDAQETLRATGRNARADKGLVDRLAAASILQSYLDRRARELRAMERAD